jgi:hypothetical protein
MPTRGRAPRHQQVATNQVREFEVGAQRNGAIDRLQGIVQLICTYVLNGLGNQRIRCGDCADREEAIGVGSREQDR